MDNLRSGLDALCDLGTSSTRFKNLYLAGDVQVGGTVKTDTIESLTGAGTGDLRMRVKGPNANIILATDTTAIVVSDAARALLPDLTNTVDLGTSQFQFKDLHLAGTLYENNVEVPKIFTESNGNSAGCTAIGSLAGNIGTATGQDCTAFGAHSLLSVTTGNSNTSVGSASLFSTTTGTDNTSVGTTSLINNVTGDANTAVGFQSLRQCTGSFNSAFGAQSMRDTTTSSRNSAFGHNCLLRNVTGELNCAFGANSLRNAEGRIIRPWELSA